MKNKIETKHIVVMSAVVVVLAALFVFSLQPQAIFIGNHPSTGGACDSYDSAMTEALAFEAGEDYNIYQGIVEPGIPQEGTCIVVNLGRVGCYSCNDLNVDSTDPNRNSAAYCGDSFEVTPAGGSSVDRQIVSTKCESDFDCNLIAGSALNDERVYQCGDRATFPSYMQCVDGWCKSYYRRVVVVDDPVDPVDPIDPVDPGDGDDVIVTGETISTGGVPASFYILIGAIVAVAIGTYIYTGKKK